MAVYKRGIAIILMAAFMLTGFISFQHDAAAAAKTRYTFSLKDVNGKAHKVTLASNNERHTIETLPSAFGQEGDPIYNGVYFLTVDGKKQAVTVRGSQVLRINTNQQDIYKVTSAAKGTPDLVLIGQRESSNYYSFEAFAVTPAGKAVKIAFKSYGSNKSSYEMYASSKLKNYSSIYFQMASYDNSEAAGWYFDTYKFNKDSYTMTGIGIYFYGYEKPFMGVKKGNYEEGRKLIARFSSEPAFAVTGGAAPQTPSLKFILGPNTKANLQAGKIPGFNVKLGMSYQQVSKALGKRVEFYYYGGAKFWNFEKTPAAGFAFGVDGNVHEPLFAAIISGPQLPKMSFAAVKAKLGAPEFEGVSELDGNYTYYYKYKDIHVYFDAADKNSIITNISITKK